MIITKTAHWLVCGIRHDQTQEDGTQKRVTEQIVIDALSFSEAEERVIKRLYPLMKDWEMEFVTCALAPFSEIIADDNPDNQSDKWFKARIALLSYDERTNKEKQSTHCYLVNADTIHTALNNIEDAFKRTMNVYRVTSIQETKITEVFHYDGGSKAKA